MPPRVGDDPPSGRARTIMKYARLAAQCLDLFFWKCARVHMVVSSGRLTSATSSLALVGQGPRPWAA